MPYTPPRERLCDCRCPLHYRRPRNTYTEAACGCSVTCATQPMTLIVEQWNCALFLDTAGNLLYVDSLGHGSWAWDSAGEIDTRHDFFEASQVLERLLRHAAQSIGPTLR
ncbi:hypothetical protein [Asanoa iriomotensis]|uniref:Uncharacterized protein n=1 Tax=Asanoa iriomotensis TaxID=234613 RepID=A0ABQ4C1G2_9ACTN|nr:hypothetical protein [Asanoa iriomotensis]GIF56623.1 hypothetical protein Air01nite_27180 [Asanoa iriomotensis]